MNLYDKLPAEDKQLIKDYLEKYSKVDSIPSLNLTLREWAKNKKTLYRVLGNNFRVKIPIYRKLSQLEFTQKAMDKYYMPGTFNTERQTEDEIKIFVKNYHIHPFIEELLYFGASFLDRPYSYEVIHNQMLKILSYPSLMNNSVAEPFEYIYKGKTLKINKGMKPMRAARKILEAFNFPKMELFEVYRQDMSMLTTLSNRDYITNLVFSIHPIDFLTMSHNTCGWSSCMNWRSGCYSNGVLEMMNSNVAVVAYLESSNQDFKVNSCYLPNKSWRCLYYVHKQIICSGKPYPYNNIELVRDGLDELAKLVKKNLNWSYDFKNQRYYDMLPYRSNESAREADFFFTKGNKILLYNYAAMYNDMVHDKEEMYWCYRNYVPRSLKICVSGPATCILCGNPITEIKDVRMYGCDGDCASRGDHPFCYRCDDKYLVSQMGEMVLFSPLYSAKAVVVNERKESYFSNEYSLYAYSYNVVATKPYIMENFRICKNFPSVITNQLKDNPSLVSQPFLLDMRGYHFSSMMLACINGIPELKILPYVKAKEEFLNKYTQPIEEEDFEQFFNSDTISLYKR